MRCYTGLILRQLVVCLGLTEREPVLNRDVLTLKIIEVAKIAAQRLDQVWNGGWREIADTPRPFLLLRVHRERPGRNQRKGPATHDATSGAVTAASVVACR